MDKPHRRIRSFVKREGRLTHGQRRALACLWPKYGVDYSAAVLDLNRLFGRDVPKTVEIGFGNGDSLWQMAVRNPDEDYLGIEVHRPGVGHLLHLIELSGITNMRIICHDAVEVLRHQIADHCLHRLQLYFPDPWPKKRHHKRRIIQADFVQLAAQKLITRGLFHLATDWQDYARHMLDIINKNKDLKNMSPQKAFTIKPKERPTTKFERRGQNLGHGVWDLVFQRV